MKKTNSERSSSSGVSIHDWNQIVYKDHRSISHNTNSHEPPLAQYFRFDSLTKAQFWAYSIGHFINDLSSACWFKYIILKEIQYISYLLYYLTYVAKFEYGSYSILSGQIADAIATPLVGYLSDKTHTRIGKRMPWYIGGSLIVIITFLPLWNGCLFCDWIQDTIQMQIIYYTLFPALFNLGWAAVQISHMSLVPSLSCGRSRRDQLNSMRNTFSFIAILFIYGTALLLFQLIEDPVVEFRYLSFVAMGVGLLATIFFIFEINERRLTYECLQIAKTLQKILIEHKINASKKGLRASTTPIDKSNQQIDTSGLTDFIEETEKVIDLENQEFDENPNIHTITKVAINKGSLAEEIVHWTQWFKEFQFYRYGLVYMGVRLYCNVSSTFLTFYLATVLGFDKTEGSNKTPIQIALIPLSLYLMSVITSSVLPQIYQKLGKKITLTLGTILCLGTSISLYFLNIDKRNLIYGIAPVIGIAQAITLNTGITLISDVIGLRGSSGAFVFGSYSFLDKISGGIVIFIFTETSKFLNKDIEYMRWVTVLVPSISCAFAWLLMILPFREKDDDKVEDLVVEYVQEDLLNKKTNLNKSVSLADELVS